MSKIPSIVLDLDNCLICTISDNIEDCKVAMRNIRLRSRIFVITLHETNIVTGIRKSDNHWGLMRPYLKEFLKYIEDRYNVIVWSAGEKRYVEAIVDVIFLDSKPPLVVLTRDDIPDINYDYHKPLKLIMQKHPGILSMDNSIIVDDRVENFRDNVGNGVTIPYYQPDVPKEYGSDDVCLMQLTTWLKNTKGKQFSLVSKANIFG